MKYIWLLLITYHNVLGQSMEPPLSLVVDTLAQEPDVVYAELEYSPYRQLQQQATSQQLRALTNHQAANVRAYAFQILVQRQAPGLEDIFRQHLWDKVPLLDATQGDVIYFMPIVPEYMLGKMMEHQYPLTHMSYEDYWQKLDTIMGRIINVEVPDIEIDPEELKEDSLK